MGIARSETRSTKNKMRSGLPAFHFPTGKGKAGRALYTAWNQKEVEA